jgi:hypothetical protein
MERRLPTTVTLQAYIADYFQRKFLFREHAKLYAKRRVRNVDLYRNAQPIAAGICHIDFLLSKDNRAIPSDDIARGAESRTTGRGA